MSSPISANSACSNHRAKADPITRTDHEPTDHGTRATYDFWATTYNNEPNGSLVPGRGFANPRPDPQPDEQILDAGCCTGDHLMHPAGYGLDKLASQPRDDSTGHRTDEASRGVEEYVMGRTGTIDWQYPLSNFDRERYGECEARSPHDRS